MNQSNTNAEIKKNSKFQFVVSAEYDWQGKNQGLFSISFCNVDLQNNEQETITKIIPVGKWGEKFEPITGAEFKDIILEKIKIALNDHFLIDKATK